MTHTTQTDKRDSIIETQDGAGTVDPGIWIVGKLRDAWDDSNTQGRTPNVDFAEEVKNVTFRDSDWIVVYSQPIQRESNADVTYQHENLTLPFQMDIFTNVSRRYAWKLWEEIRRILYGGRKDTFDGVDDDNLLTGRQWLELGQLQFLTKTNNGFWRFVGEVSVNWRWRTI